MRVLVLGASGMLGHKLVQRMAHGSASGAGFTVAGTLRSAVPDRRTAAALAGARLFCSIAAEHPQALETVFDAFAPDAVVNAVGLVKQQKTAVDPVAAITLNALFPHQVAALCRSRGIRFVQFSTDCVFTGERGPYRTEDLADASDLYGRTKRLGEVEGEGCVTIRSSIIGHELRDHLGLIDWFLSQRGGRVRGFARALYTGLPTVVMADLVRRLLTDWTDLSGVWQVASEPISKFNLLTIVNEVYGLGVTVEEDDIYHCDRRLDGSAFTERTGWRAPSWRALVEAMHADHDPAIYGPV